MTNEVLSDLEIARRISKGNEQALKDLYNSYADLLFVFIRNLLHEVPQIVAEDIWQETLLSTIKSIASFQGNSRLFTWMCGIAKHKVFDYYRERKIIPNPESHFYTNDEENLRDTNILPEEYLLRQDVRARVIEALGIIPLNYQTILMQRYINEDSVEEIAESLGKTYKAAESLLSRAREAFKIAFNRLSKEKRNE